MVSAKEIKDGGDLWTGEEVSLVGQGKKLHFLEFQARSEVHEEI